MVNLECCLRFTRTPILPPSKPRLPSQQYRKTSKIRKDVAVALSQGKEQLGGRGPLSLVLKSSASHLCLAAADSLSSSSSSSSSSSDNPISAAAEDSSRDQEVEVPHSQVSFAAAAAAEDADLSRDSAAAAVEEAASFKEEKVPKSFWQNWRTNAAELRAQASKWGLAAVLAYGLLDAITYTTLFVLAFLSYEKSTGKNPAADLKALLGVVVLMWGGNNVTRPIRLAVAAAAAPFIDTGLKKMRQILRLPNEVFAFMLCVAVTACICFLVVAVLILSRLG